MERPATLGITVGGSEEHERGLGPWGWIERRQGDTERQVKAERSNLYVALTF